MLIATDVQKLSNLVKHEYGIDYAYCRELVIVNDTAGTLEQGRVLGQVTATGKYKRHTQAGDDGSQNAAAVVLFAKAIVGSTDTLVLALVRGPVGVSKAGLVLDAAVNDDAKRSAVYAALAAKGIQTLDAV